MADRPRLRALADRVGIVASYTASSRRERRVTSDATREALLAAMGFDATTETAADQALRAIAEDEQTRLLDPVRVVVAGGPEVARVPVCVPLQERGPGAWSVELCDERGQTSRSEGSLRSPRRTPRATLPLPGPLDPGYHRLRVVVETPEGPRQAQQSLVVAPSRCATPDDVLGGRPGFGLLVNLYALRSQRNWGAGDLGDLRRLVAWASEVGAALVGVNPLHALWNRGSHVSPYAPLSRLYRNPLYLDLGAVPELAECPEAQARLADSGFQRRLAALRDSPRVEYQQLAELKREILDLLHRSFASRHRDRATVRGRAYARFLEREGRPLTDFATFLALAEHLSARHPEEADWRRWPAAYRNPDSAAVARFRSERPEAVDFHRYLQFELERQLVRVAGDRLVGGLYQDLAIGTAPTGCDPWAFPGLFVEGATVGAPPDDFAEAGQDWGLPPLDPRRLRSQAYAYWVRLLRSAFAHAGALRLDHVMGLARLFWIPAGRPPARELLGILALESQRHRALVIGEDLGTVPRGFASRLARWGVLSSRVLYFERRNGGFRPARSYSRRAVVTANTHDLPPLAGFMAGRDLAIRREIGQLGSAAELHETQRERREACAALLRRLAAEGLLRGERKPPAPEELSAAVIGFLCRTPAPLVGISLEDLTGETEPANVPGVSLDRFPSWTQRLRVPVEELASFPFARRVLAAVSRERRMPGSPEPPAPDSGRPRSSSRTGSRKGGGR
jgi:4-alpha-glucanotransferase